MKSLILFSLLASLTACSSGSHSSSLFSLPSQPDSIYVAAYVDVPARISCQVKLSVDALDSYHVGQRILCSLAPGSDPNLLGSPVYVEDVGGQVPVIVNSLENAR